MLCDSGAGWQPVCSAGLVVKLTSALEARVCVWTELALSRCSANVALAVWSQAEFLDQNYSKTLLLPVNTRRSAADIVCGVGLH